MKTKLFRILSISLLVILFLVLVTLVAGAIAKSNLAKKYPAPGQLVDAEGVFLAPAMQRVGRRVRVERRTHTIFESNAIPGRAIIVEIFDREQRTTASISRWIPDPEPDS